MAKSRKLKFDRECGFTCDYQIEDTKLGKLEFNSKGQVVLFYEGITTTIEPVDELEVKITPLNVLVNKVTFLVSKIDKTKANIDSKFYGVLGKNINMNWDNELSGDTEE